MTRSHYPLPSDPATRAALRRAGFARSIAGFGIVAMLIAAASVAGLGGNDPARAADTAGEEGRITAADQRPQSSRSGLADEFRLDERELHDYRSNVHG